MLQKKLGGAPYRKTGIIDGDRWICLDEKLDIQPNKCVVLSFGINNEWSFDDDIEKLGCMVC